MSDIWPTHPLFRIIWIQAFDRAKMLVLEIEDGKGPTADANLQEAMTTTTIAGWGPITKKIMAHCGKHGIVIDTDKILLRAAAGGHIAAMHEARTMGATDFNWALECAAAGGHVDAMREAVRMGATNFDWALIRAADGGHVDAMREGDRFRRGTQIREESADTE
jgi:hypothetical protein